MAYKSGVCFVCDEDKSVQDHHLLPVEYGGPKDGPQVKLCPTCHLTCHYEAEAFYKTGDFLNLHTAFQDKATLNRAMGIIKRILHAKQQFEDSGKPAEDARRRINLSFSHEELLLVHEMKRVLKFRSLERLVKSCISAKLQEMRSKGIL